MTAIRVIFDGKSFIPQQPVSLPAEPEAMVIIEQSDPVQQAKLDAEVQAYFENGADAEDDARRRWIS